MFNRLRALLSRHGQTKDEVTDDDFFASRRQTVPLSSADLATMRLAPSGDSNSTESPEEKLQRIAKLAGTEH